ncbi:hypothetical protein NQ314_002773 [Rhamnusium bicolor]|uniref:Uncharacterized protein n=1 Tax=Rhamnusium bicolor TaxID=1586634 RepID=A0AAV8ZPL5_9CUCU|nr:hypothetical protein NQ314_002773 [Rhamnusium bicolor]
MSTVESRVTSPKKAFKHDYELLATHHDTGVGAHGERTYDLQLAIPKSTLVPNFNLCELFKHWTLLTVSIYVVLIAIRTNRGSS